jgi:tetratricopeptide (TPR) repeat protein
VRSQLNAKSLGVNRNHFVSEIEDLEFVLAAWKAGEYQRVVTRGSSVIESGAKASSIIMLYADSLVELDRIVEAREALKLALEMLPSRHRRIYNALAAIELHAECNAAAEEYCQLAISLAPDHATAYIYLGVCYMSTDRIAEAEIQFAQATKCTDGAIDEAWYNLGRAQSVLGQTREAEISYRRALEIDPEYETALEELAALKSRGTHALDA